jgi:hypothetical protein
MIYFHRVLVDAHTLLRVLKMRLVSSTPLCLQTTIHYRLPRCHNRFHDVRGTHWGMISNRVLVLMHQDGLIPGSFDN